jgi:hypothetical protein
MSGHLTTERVPHLTSPPRNGSRGLEDGLAEQLSYLDSEMTSVRNGAAGYVGQRVPASARLTASNYAQYAIPIRTAHGYLRLDDRYIGRHH